MFNIKRIAAVIISYLAVFAGTLAIYGYIQNSGTVSGSLQENSAALPLLYVQSGGSLINEMHGYVSDIDGGYLRDTMTPVDDSRTVNLVIRDFKDHVSSASYELYNDQNAKLVEKGACSDIVKNDSDKDCRIKFAGSLKTNCEYVLRIKLKTSGGKKITYYTRVRYGPELKIDEKLRFVLDFNEKTFSKDNASALQNYLESSTGSVSTGLDHVDAYSPVNDVTWRDLSPRRSSDISIRLKEINTETASFTLSYSVRAKTDSVKNFYRINEYYRIRLGDEKIYLLDFRRDMQLEPELKSAQIQSGKLWLGLGDGSDTRLTNFGTGNQSYSCICRGNSLSLYDSTSNILTNVYKDTDISHNCGHMYDQGIRVIHTDAGTGDIYFALYGYIHTGRYEGSEGVMIYHFSYADDKLEELLFVPYKRGFHQLEEGIESVACKTGDSIYFRIEDKIYRYDISTSRMTTALKGADRASCASSDSGQVAVSHEPVSGTGAGDKITVEYLGTSRKKTIKEDGMLVMPLGYLGEDLVYGTVNRADIAEDSTGTLQIPVSQVHIVDKDLKEIKTYSKSGKCIMRTDISDGMINFTLGKKKKNGSFTDYEDAGSDYIVHNAKKEEEEVSLAVQSDGSFGKLYYLQLTGTRSFVPVTQTARKLDPGYDISREYDPQKYPDVRYYVYTRGGLAADFATIKEAVDYGNDNAGTVMTSRKQIAWQRAGRAYVWDLGIETIDKAKNNGQYGVLLSAIASYEGWEAPSDVSESSPLYAQMEEKLKGQTVNLTGMELTDVLHFVYRDRLVAARTGKDSYCLITGYTNDRIRIADVSKGEVSSISWDEAKKTFEEQGNVFYSYFD